jgi:signal transduction histidine kinase
MRWWTPARADGLLALVLTAFGQLNLRIHLDGSATYGPAFGSAVATAAATGVLALRRRAPLLTMVSVAAAVAGPELFTRLTFTLWGGFLPLLVAAYSVARHAERRAAWTGLAVAVLCAVVVMLRVPEAGTTANIPFAVIPLASVFAAGRVLRRREHGHHEERARAERLEQERDAAVAAAISDKRSRIAQELHDIVTHCVSVMVVQAGAAEDLLDRDSDKARRPLALVQETGRQAVGELSRMLGLLRGSADSPDLVPQPGTAEVAELVRHMTEVGLPVELSVHGTPRPLPPGHALTLYRIVQEALTNSLKHAAPTTATVALRYGDQSVEVDVRDTGRAAPRPPEVTAAVGHGLIGMRERVNLYAGTLTTGQSPDGGFAVRACLPVKAP